MNPEINYYDHHELNLCIIINIENEELLANIVIATYQGKVFSRTESGQRCRKCPL